MSCSTEDADNEQGLLRAASEGELQRVQRYLEKGTSVNGKGLFGLTPLHAACSSQHVTIILLLLDRGAEVDAKDEDGSTPLHWACLKGHRMVVSLLLECGADVDAINVSGRTPLDNANQKGHKTVATLLLEKGARTLKVDNNNIEVPNLPKPENKSYVLCARSGAQIAICCDHSKYDGQKAVRKWHSSVSCREHELFAANASDEESIAQSSMVSNVSIASTNRKNATAPLAAVNDSSQQGESIVLASIHDKANDQRLLCAAGDGQLEQVRNYLLEGADPNAKGGGGWTPIHSACQNGHVDIVALLLEKGARVNCDKHDGWTPLHSASYNGHDKVVALLLEKGAKIFCNNADGWTPLHWACVKGHAAVVSLLLQGGAEAIAKDAMGRTPLSIASGDGHVNVVELLLKHGADVNTFDNYDWAPLHLASSKGHKHVVCLLLASGANINCKVLDGQTPFHLASSNGHDSVAKLLMKENAEREKIITKPFLPVNPFGRKRVRAWRPSQGEPFSANARGDESIFDSFLSVSNDSISHGESDASASASAASVDGSSERTGSIPSQKLNLEVESEGPDDDFSLSDMKHRGTKRWIRMVSQNIKQRFANDNRKPASKVIYEENQQPRPRIGHDRQPENEQPPFHSSRGSIIILDENCSLVNTEMSSLTTEQDREEVENHALLDGQGDRGIYTGTLLAITSTPHGPGQMQYEDGRFYKGGWSQGRWNGYGRVSFSNGDRYEGEYWFQRRHGHGIYQWSNGKVYDGGFIEDRYHGEGTMEWPDGSRYEGGFIRGQREGYGIYTLSDNGGQYKGYWVDGRFDGLGTFVGEDGHYYRGQWRNGMKNGEGFEVYPDGQLRHDGQWINDEPVL